MQSDGAAEIITPQLACIINHLLLIYILLCVVVPEMSVVINLDTAEVKEVKCRFSSLITFPTNVTTKASSREPIEAPQAEPTLRMRWVCM